jgi:HEAT repeat protein
LVEIVAALAEIGPPAKNAAPALLKIAGDEERGLVGSFIVIALGNMGSGIVDDLRNALADNTVPRRRVAAEALGLIGPKANAATPALAGCLKDGDEQVRLQVAKSLGKIGPDAKEAMPMLRSALKDAAISVRLETALALWRIDPAELQLPVVLDTLNDPSAQVRGDACRILGTIGPAANGARAALDKTLADKESSVRQQGAEALGRLGSGAAASALAVQKLFADDEALVRITAALAYWRITSEANKALEVLAKGLKDDDRLVKKMTIQNIGDMGAAAQPLVPTLTDIAHEDDGNLREAARNALKKIDPGAAKKAGVR